MYVFYHFFNYFCFLCKKLTMDYQERFNSFLQRNDLKNKTKALEKIQYLLNTLPKYTRLENQILHDLLTLHSFFL